MLMYPINKMYAIPEKKPGIKWSNWNIQYKIVKKKKTKQTKEHMKCSYMYVYTYDFRRGVVTDI